MPAWRVQKQVGYNELVIDARSWTENLPHTIAAIFIVSADDAAAGRARSVRAALMRAYGLSEDQAPPVGDDAVAQEAPATGLSPPPDVVASKSASAGAVDGNEQEPPQDCNEQEPPKDPPGSVPDVDASSGKDAHTSADSGARDLQVMPLLENAERVVQNL